MLGGKSSGPVKRACEVAVSFGLCGIAALTPSACSPANTEPPDADPPTGSVQADWDAFDSNMTSCMGDAGFDIQTFGDGSIQISLDESLSASYEAALTECMTKFGYDAPREYTDEQMSAIYQDTLDLVDCLEREGYAITNIPSEQAFKDSRYFFPYEEVPYTLDAEEWESLQRECPAPVW